MYPLKIKEKYDSLNLEQLSHRFTTAYLGNYISGDFRENVGSHPGVDIVPISKGQDVLVVLDGVVFKSGEDGAYGKYVFIEHTGVPDENFITKTTLYSCYLHLSDISVKTGDIIKEGQVIGKTGNTGISYGEHLHFQIDKQDAPFHSYWPYTGADVAKIGVSFSEGVNKALGIENARKFTINPLVYLDKLEEYRKNYTVQQPTEKIETIKKEEDIIISSNKKDEDKNLVEEKIETIKKEEDVIISSNNLLNDILGDDSKKKI